MTIYGNFAKNWLLIALIAFFSPKNALLSQDNDEKNLEVDLWAFTILYTI